MSALFTERAARAGRLAYASRGRRATLATVALAGPLALLAACGTTGLERGTGADAARSGAAQVAPDGSTAGAEVAAGGLPGFQEAAVPERARQAHDRALDAMARQDWTEAELELEQLVLEFDRFPGPFVNLAIVYLASGRTSEAEAVLESALETAPGHAAANNQLGIVLRRQGRFDEAEAAYRRALETDPDSLLAHYNLGVLLDLYLYRRAEALEHYERYQRMLPEPDDRVAGWIIDLQRRLDVRSREAARVAQEDPS